MAEKHHHNIEPALGWKICLKWKLNLRQISKWHYCNWCINNRLCFGLFSFKWEFEPRTGCSRRRSKQIRNPIRVFNLFSTLQIEHFWNASLSTAEKRWKAIWMISFFHLLFIIILSALSIFQRRVEKRKISANNFFSLRIRERANDTIMPISCFNERQLITFLEM